MPIHFYSQRLATVLLLLLLVLVQPIRAGIPFRRRRNYTPLVFFKVPQGNIAECDEMEQVIKQVEQELGVRVERLDIARDPSAAATLNVLTHHGPPYLYHRESLQTIFVLDPMGSRKETKLEENSVAMPKIDKDRVRAWAKGRYLPPPGLKFGLPTSNNAPVLISKEDNAMDQDELEALKDMSLTPEQLQGKQAMKERTAKRAQKASN
jgi:hypothetical protein